MFSRFFCYLIVFCLATPALAATSRQEPVSKATTHKASAASQKVSGKWFFFFARGTGQVWPRYYLDSLRKVFAKPIWDRHLCDLLITKKKGGDGQGFKIRKECYQGLKKLSRKPGVRIILFSNWGKSDKRDFLKMFFFKNGRTKKKWQYVVSRHRDTATCDWWVSAFHAFFRKSVPKRLGEKALPLKAKIGKCYPKRVAGLVAKGASVVAVPRQVDFFVNKGAENRYTRSLLAKLKEKLGGQNVQKHLLNSSCKGTLCLDEIKKKFPRLPSSKAGRVLYVETRAEQAQMSHSLIRVGLVKLGGVGNRQCLVWWRGFVAENVNNHCLDRSWEVLIRSLLVHQEADDPTIGGGWSQVRAMSKDRRSNLGLTCEPEKRQIALADYHVQGNLEGFKRVFRMSLKNLANIRQVSLTVLKKGQVKTAGSCQKIGYEFECERKASRNGFPKHEWISLFAGFFPGGSANFTLERCVVEKGKQRCQERKLTIGPYAQKSECQIAIVTFFMRYLRNPVPTRRSVFEAPSDCRPRFAKSSAKVNPFLLGAVVSSGLAVAAGVAGVFVGTLGMSGAVSSFNGRYQQVEAKPSEMGFAELGSLRGNVEAMGAGSTSLYVVSGVALAVAVTLGILYFSSKPKPLAQKPLPARDKKDKDHARVAKIKRILPPVQ
ncbi:hypothetical protein KKC60_00180 [Patescibacteria group bacterium]|nr:hypothetical protein [Patescibacteria group bacterium]